MADQMNPNITNDPKHNVGARNAAIQKGFAERFKLEQAIKAMTEKHVQPLKDEVKKLNRDLKKNTDIDSVDLTLNYKLFARQESAKLLEDDDRDRILDNLRATFDAIGGQLDFVSAMESAGTTGSEDEDDQPSEAVLEQARKVGRAAGENGEDGVSPYADGSASDTAWKESWLEAQTENASAMGKTGTDD